MPAKAQKRKRTDESEGRVVPATDTGYDVLVPESVREFFLTAEISGQGGFQSLFRMLEPRMRSARVVRFTHEEIERIARYATQYGDGGFQSQLRHLVTAWTEQNITKLHKG